MAQLYLSFPKPSGEPPKVLRRFVKVPLAAGASTTVTFDPLVPAEDLSVWEEEVHAWTQVNHISPSPSLSLTLLVILCLALTLTFTLTLTRGRT